MTVNVEPIKQTGLAAPARDRTFNALRFDWIVALLSTWFLIGAFTDGWAHNHIVDQLESFFTPWHALLYSGFAATAGYVLYHVIRNRAAGMTWREAIPAGHELTVLGLFIFAAGGVGDMLWHTIFGIEANVDAAFSPSHLVLMGGATLFLSGPLRAAWRRAEPQRHYTWANWLPLLLSLTLTVSLLAFITQYAHPLVSVLAATFSGDAGQIIGAVSIMLQTAILMGAVLLALRRWQLPTGSLTLIFTLNALAMSFMQDTYFLIPAVVLAGLAADGLLLWLRPSASRPAALRLFAFLAPVLYYLFYFVTVMLTTGMSWTVHMWTGATVIAGFVGLFLTLFLWPPAVPQE